MDKPTGRYVFALQVLLLLLLVACLTAAFGDAPGTSDVFLFIQWVKNIGPADPFTGFGFFEMDYPPLSFLTMSLSAKVGHHFGIPDLQDYKAPLGLFTAAACLLVLARTRSPAEALVIMLIATPFGLVLGYYDVEYLPFLLIAFYAAQDERWAVAGAALAIAALIKWQPLILAPLFVLAAFRGRQSLRQFGLALVPTIIVVTIILILFTPVAVYHALLKAMANEYLSGQGANVGWLVSYLSEFMHVAGLELQPSGLVQILVRDPDVPTVGWIMLGLRLAFYAWFMASLGIYMVGRRTIEAFQLSALSISLVQFTWNTGVHENHMFVPMVAAFVSWQSKSLDGFLFISIAAIAILNMLLFYGVGDGFEYRSLLGLDSTVILALAEILAFVLVFHCQVSACLGKHRSPAALAGGGV
jgi:hypothetical protein